MARKYQHTQELLPQIKEMLAEGMTQKQLEALYDNSIVAYKMDTQQTVNLVLDTIRLAERKEKVAVGRLQLHSNHGTPYTSQAYFELTKEYGNAIDVTTGKLR